MKKSSLKETANFLNYLSTIEKTTDIKKLKRHIKCLHTLKTHGLITRRVHQSTLNKGLRISIERKNEPICLALLNAGANPKEHESLALRLAATNRFFKIMPALVNHGANPMTGEAMCLNLLCQAEGKAQKVERIIKFITKKIIDNGTHFHEAGLGQACKAALLKKRYKIASILLELYDSKSLKELARAKNNDPKLQKFTAQIIAKRHSKLIEKATKRNHSYEI